MKEANKNHTKSSLDLKSRLFEKGLNYSTLGPLKSPLASDTPTPNRNLLVNLASSNTSKNSPKVLRKQVSCMNTSKNSSKRFMIRDHIKTEKEEGENLSPVTSKKKNFFETSKSQFYNNLKNKENASQIVTDNSQTYENFSNSKEKSNQLAFDSHHKEIPFNNLEEFQRTKTLMEKLSGKNRSPSQTKEKQRPQVTSKEEERIQYPQTSSPKLKWHQKQAYGTSNYPRNLQSYISLALKNQKNLQEFLYLVNRKYLVYEESYKKSSQIDEDNHYDLQILPQPLTSCISGNKKKQDGIESTGQGSSRQLEITKFYTVSKKGFCHYHNNKPIEFIELEDWLNEKNIYEKIKRLSFFNKFKRWKIVKMWRKKVLKHRIEECSKNLEEKLFWLNPTMRTCLFEVRAIDLKLGKNMVIVNRNLQNSKQYSLDNFKIIQEKTKRDVASIIEDYSRESRKEVHKCFQEVLRSERIAVKEKQENEDKLATITSQINAKDAAFQALGFPPKMSYENRSRLRKMAGNFIRFSYLIDMIHCASLAYFFSSELSAFIESIKESQIFQPAEIVLKKEQGTKTNESQQESVKMFNVKVSIQARDSDHEFLDWLSQQFKNQPLLQQICNDKFLNQRSKNKKDNLRFQTDICDYYLKLLPEIDQIYDQLAIHIRQSSSSLKYFQRWSRHRDMERFINILEEWDDVVTQSRQIADNQNLDPLPILSSFDESLQLIKTMIGEAGGIIYSKIKEQMTSFLNVYAELQKVDLNKFRDENLENPAQTIQIFLSYLTNQLQKFETKIPQQIKYSIFEVYLPNVKHQMISKLISICEEFKIILPNIIEDRTFYLNNWLTKYNEVIKQEVKNIDDFVNKVKYIKEIEETLEIKKDLCHNLSSIYHTMEVHRINTKKRKDFQTITLKLKDQLQQQLNTFQQTRERQSEAYIRQITRTYFPNIIKDAKKLQSALQNPKFYVRSSENETPIQQLKKLQSRYYQIEGRNQRYCEYQLILNSYIAESDNNPTSKSIKSLGLIKSNKNIQLNHTKSPIYTQHLYSIKQTLMNLILLWQQTEEWTKILEKFQTFLLKDILEEKQMKNLQLKVSDSKQLLKRLKNRPLLPQDPLISQELVSQLHEKVMIFESSLPLIVGFAGQLTQQHWAKINEIACKCGANYLDLKQSSEINFREFIKSGINGYREELQQIFYKAKNQISLQKQYSQLEEKWETQIVKTKVQGKYHFIISDEEEVKIIDLFDHSIRIMVKIMANPFSDKLKFSVVTYEHLLFGLQSFKKYIIIQHKYVALEKLLKNIDLKKLPQPSILEQFDKHQKALQKFMQSRNNIENGFKLIKLIQPPDSIKIHEKFEESLQFLNSLANGIIYMVRDYRKNSSNTANLLIQLNDDDLLKIVMNPGQVTIQTIQWACEKLLGGVIKKVVLTGQRITNLISYDNEDLLKTPISINAELQQIMEQIADSIADVTRKTMRNCRVKSLESPSLLSTEIVSEFNAQFLLAINKVDFSNYAAISIENRGQNYDSVKEYLRILRKDTSLGINKLRDSILNQNNIEIQNKVISISHKALVNFEAILLQNLIHQEILSEIIKQDVYCANDFVWINQLRFTWQDNGMSLDETNIVAKKVHATLRYGKQYIGSRTKVIMNTDIDFLSAIKYSEVVFFDGLFDRLKMFADCIAHRVKVIPCTSQTTLNQLNNILVAYSTYDCLFYFKNPNQLHYKVWYEIINYSFLDKYSKRGSLASTNQNSYPNTSTNLNHLQTTSQNPIYNPIFIELKKWAHSEIDAYKSKYRLVGLVAPSRAFIDCQLKLATWTTETAQKQEFSVFVESTCLKILENQKKLLANRKSNSNSFNTGQQQSCPSISHYLLQIFSLASELTGISEIKIEDFLTNLNSQLKNLNISTFAQKAKQKGNEAGLEKQHNLQTIKTIFINIQSYLQDKLIQPYLSLIQSSIQSIASNSFGIQPSANSQKRPYNDKRIKIITGLSFMLTEQIHEEQVNEKIEYINLHEHNHTELYGTFKKFGILDQLIFTEDLLNSSYGAVLFSEIVQKKQTVLVQSENTEFGVKQTLMRNAQKIIKKLNSKPKTKTVLFLNEKENLERVIYIKGVSETLINYLLEINQIFQSIELSQKKYLPEIRIICEKVDTHIDPRILSDFQIKNITLDEEHIGESFKRWAHRFVIQAQVTNRQLFNEKEREFIYDEIMKFFMKHIKHLWRNIYNKPESSNDKNRCIQQQKVIINRFTKLFEAFYSCLPSTSQLYKTIPSMNQTSPPHPSPLTELLCYCLIQAYYPFIPVQNPNYLKLQTMIKKIIGDQRLRDESNFYQYAFDGHKLIHSHEYYEKYVPEEKRIINRGRFYISQEFASILKTISQVFNNTPYGIRIVGSKMSGKSALIESYKYENYDDLKCFRISMKHQNRTKRQLYDRVSSILYPNDTTTLKPQLYYNRSTFIIEDLALPLKRQTSPVCEMLETMNEFKQLRVPNKTQKYKLNNVNILLTSQSDNHSCEFISEKFDDFMVKVYLGKMKSAENILKNVFVEIVKGNLMDTEIPDMVITDAVSLMLAIYQEINQKLSQSEVKIDISVLKKISTHVSHLRFKQNCSSLTQIERFWASMLLEQLEPYSKQIGLPLKSLQSIDFMSRQSLYCKNIIQKFNEVPMYSHLHIKQQQHSIGKQVELVKQIIRMESFINEKILKYNEQDDLNKRYGQTFEFLAVRQLITKIIKMANQILGGDYAMLGINTEGSYIIKLTSHLMGFNYKQKFPEISLLSTIKNIIPEITNFSSNLITMKVTPKNYRELLEYYDRDLETELVSLHRTNNKKSLPQPNTAPGFHPFFNQTSKPYQSEPLSALNYRSTSNKLTFKQMSNLLRSIRIVYQINDISIIREHLEPVTGYISYDFFEQYPKQSIVRFTEDILDINDTELCESSSNILFDIYQGLRKGIRTKTDSQNCGKSEDITLNISLKQYDESVKLYSYFANFLPNEFKTGINKCSSIINLYDSLQSIVSNLTTEIQNLWQEKNKISMKLQKIRQNSSSCQNALSLQSSFAELAEKLQLSTELKSQCEKILSYLQPAIGRYRKKHESLTSLCKDKIYLKQILSIVASYITYLSKYPFTTRKQHLKSWYNNLESLKKIPEQQRIYSISELFCLIRQEQILLFKPYDDSTYSEDEEFYQNMVIILQSVKPVIIQDQQGRGAKWLKQFDKSFIILPENDDNFFVQLSKYLQEGTNILIQLGSQDSLFGIHNSYLANLLEMSEGTPKIEINGTQIEVSRETKVYILSDEKFQIPEENGIDFLRVNYGCSREKYKKSLRQQLLMRENGDRYVSYQETISKIQEITVKLSKFQIGMTESVWREFYGKQSEQLQKNMEERGSENQLEIENKQICIRQKSDQEIIACVRSMNKKFLEFHRENLQKLNSKKKMIPELEERLPNTTPNFSQSEQLCQSVEILYETLNKMQAIISDRPLSIGQFYTTISQAVKQDYVSNKGIFIIFALKQWGQKYDRQNFLIFAWTLICRINGYSMESITEFIDDLSKKSPENIEQLRIKIGIYKEKETLLMKVRNKILNGDFSFQFEAIEECLADQIISYLQGKTFEQISGLCTIKRLPISKQLIHLKLETARDINKTIGEKQIVNHLIIYTGRITHQKLLPEANLPIHSSIHNNFNTMKTLNNGQHQKPFNDLNGIFKKLSEDIENSPCFQIKNGDNIDADMKKALNERKNVYLNSSYLSNEGIIKKILNVNQEKQEELREKKVSQSNDKQLFRIIMIELLRFYELNEEKDKIQEKMKNSGQRNRKRNSDDIKKEALKFGGTYTKNVNKIEIPDDFKIFIYLETVDEALEVFEEIFGKANGLLSKVDIRNTELETSHLLKKIYLKMQNSQPLESYRKNSSKLQIPKTRQTRKKVTLTPINEKSGESETNSKANLRQKLNIQQAKIMPLPSINNISDDNQEYLVTASKILFEHFKQYNKAFNIESEHEQNSSGKLLCSQYIFNNIEKMRQKISQENTKWTVQQQTFTLLQIFYHLIDPSMSNRANIAKKNNRWIKQWYRFLDSLIGQLTKTFELMSDMNSEQTEEGLQLTEKVLQIMRCAIQIDQIKKLKYLREGRRKLVKNVKLIVLKKTWLQKFRRYLQLPALNQNVYISDSIFDSNEDPSEKPKKDQKKPRSSLLVNKKINPIPQCKLKHQSKKNIHRIHQPSLKVKNQLPIQLLKFQTTLCTLKMELLKQDLKTIEKTVNLDPQFFNEAHNHLFSSFFYQLQLNEGIVPQHWNMVISTKQDIELSTFESFTLKSESHIFESQVNGNDVSIKSNIRALHCKIKQGEKDITTLRLLTETEQEYGGEEIRLQNMNKPVNFLRMLLSKQDFKCYFTFPEANVHKDITEFHKNKTTSPEQIYLLTHKLTEQQLEDRNFLKIKNLYAQGWRLGSQGYVEIIQQDKINRKTLVKLNGMMIVKRKRIHQMTLCKLVVHGPYYHEFPKLSCQKGRNKVYTEPSMIIYAYTKKLAPGWKGNLFIKQ